MIVSFKTEGTGIGFDFDVVFHKAKKIHCIIGKNGIGKTKLLEYMAKTLLFKHSMFLTRENEQYIYKELFLQTDIFMKIKDFTLKLPLDIEVNGIKVKNKNLDKWSHTTFEQLIHMHDPSFVCDKPIVFIGAKNRGYTENIDPNNIKILPNAHDRFVESITRTMHYIDGKGLEHEEVANWFVSRLIVNPNFVRNGQHKENEVVTVLELMEKLDPSLKLVTKTPEGKRSLSIIFEEGQLLINGVPLDKLSTGFVSIIKIFQEIVAGYGGWSNSDDLSQVDGIVFIDEVEPHLHISWQTKIINILKTFFPKTTFYITTHSPLVLSGLKEGEAYELYEENKVVKTKAISNVDDYALIDIINQFFDVDLNRNKIENPNMEKQKKARALLSRLTESLDEDVL